MPDGIADWLIKIGTLSVLVVVCFILLWLLTKLVIQIVNKHQQLVDKALEVNQRNTEGFQRQVDHFTTALANLKQERANENTAFLNALQAERHQRAEIINTHNLQQREVVAVIEKGFEHQTRDLKESFIQQTRDLKESFERQSKQH